MSNFTQRIEFFCLKNRNMPFERKHLPLLTTRLKEKRRFIQVLAGPRQVGKTTLVNQRVLLIGEGGLPWPEFLAMQPGDLF